MDKKSNVIDYKEMYNKLDNDIGDKQVSDYSEKIFIKYIKLSEWNEHEEKIKGGKKIK